MSENSVPLIIVGILLMIIGGINRNPSQIEKMTRVQNARLGVKTDEKALRDLIPGRQRFYSILFVVGLLILLVGLFVIDKLLKP